METVLKRMGGIKPIKPSGRPGTNKENPIIVGEGERDGGSADGQANKALKLIDP